MGVVDVEDRRAGAGDRVKLGHRRDLAAHAVDAVDTHQGAAIRPQAFKRLLKGAGSLCAKVATLVPLARAILAASCIELCAISSRAIASWRPVRPGIAPRLASITDGIDQHRLDAEPLRQSFSASILARTLAKARDAPLWVPHLRRPRRTAR